jgi:hypothetical protein
MKKKNKRVVAEINALLNLGTRWRRAISFLLFLLLLLPRGSVLLFRSIGLIYSESALVLVKKNSVLTGQEAGWVPERSGRLGEQRNLSHA